MHSTLSIVSKFEAVSQNIIYMPVNSVAHNLRISCHTKHAQQAQ